MNKSMIIFDFQGTLSVRGALFPGIEHIIQELSKTHTLCIVSASSKRTIDEALKQADLSSCFTEIVSNEILTTKTDVIRNLLRIYSIPKHRTVFVSDTQDDMQTAIQLHITPIFVAWGIERDPGDPKIPIAKTPQELYHMIAEALPVDQER